MTVDPTRLNAAYQKARSALLAKRNEEGYWTGELSSSALSTAVACIALKLVGNADHRLIIEQGFRWLAETQNDDGGWGDTTRSHSNISTSMLVRAAFEIGGQSGQTVEKLERHLDVRCGRTPAERAEAIRNRYGKDRTFSVPILMTCALAGLVPWNEVPRLPFELACLPQSWYRFARMPVVSYALPALIAIGQCVHAHRPTWNPYSAMARRLARGTSLKVLRRIQPSSGGYLEATPLTAFVVMSLATLARKGVSTAESKAVLESGVEFIVQSMRPDGSWPIDTNLSIWVSTLSVNALAASGDLDALDRKDELLTWLWSQQTKTRHPFTGAEPGAWGWSHCPGSGPDCDDTPGAMIAIHHLEGERNPHRNQTLAVNHAMKWVLRLQNRDGGVPTFCRGWGKLPFDRSGSDLTAHALRALHVWQPDPDTSKARLRLDGQTPNPFAYQRFTKKALDYLKRNQRADGSWLPLWFGNQFAPDDENPVYGTTRVLAAYRDLGLQKSEECRRGVAYLLSVQNPDGSWGGAKGCPGSVEETSLAVEVLLDLSPGEAVDRGLNWLMDAVESGRFCQPSPIGFYFAKLWYFEELYPLIWITAALGRAQRNIPQS
ncbi:MAG: prenyltransferase/squalene oxidase repeat-containing protein [Gemmataceae bacterium]